MTINFWCWRAVQNVTVASVWRLDWTLHTPDLLYTVYQLSLYAADSFYAAFIIYYCCYLLCLENFSAGV